MAQDEWYANYCPSCGKNDVVIVEDQGWCISCTKEHHPDLSICPLCITTFPRTNNTTYCSACKTEGWLREHADAIEEYILQGFSVGSAKAKVAADIRPICACCGNSIKGANPGSNFCTVSAKCRSARRRYRTLTKILNGNKTAALAQVLREVENANRTKP